jgi:iron complex transport system ATP-binding protein
LGILLVTHHVSEIIPEIERIVLLRDGKIVADGPKAEMLTAPRLTDLFATRVQIGHHDSYYHLY